MIGGGLGAENEIAFKTERLKEESQESWGKVFLANSAGYFVNILSV